MFLLRAVDEHLGGVKLPLGVRHRASLVSGCLPIPVPARSQKGRSPKGTLNHTKKGQCNDRWNTPLPSSCFPDTLRRSSQRRYRWQIFRHDPGHTSHGIQQL